MMQGEDRGLKRQIDLCCNESTFLTVWLLNSIKAFWLWDFLPIKQGHFFFYLIVFMYLASCLAKRQHSKNNSSHSMNVIILCMVSFLLLIKKTIQEVFQYGCTNLHCIVSCSTFSPMPEITYVFHFSHFGICKIALHNDFNLHFPWWLMRLSINSYLYWQCGIFSCKVSVKSFIITVNI